MSASGFAAKRLRPRRSHCMPLYASSQRREASLAISADGDLYRGPRTCGRLTPTSLRNASASWVDSSRRSGVGLTPLAEPVFWSGLPLERALDLPGVVAGCLHAVDELQSVVFA